MIVKLTKEQIEAEKQKRRELKSKNSAKIKRLWTKDTQDIFPSDFEDQDDFE